MSTKRERNKWRQLMRGVATANRAVQSRGWVRAFVTSTGPCTGTIDAFVGNQWIDYGALCDGMIIIDESGYCTPEGYERWKRRKDALK